MVGISFVVYLATLLQNCEVIFCKTVNHKPASMSTKEETKEVVKIPTKVDKVVVHPLVLLSVVDHFNRMGKVGNVKRVVGVLLGSNRQGVLDISNSFAGL